MKKILKMRGICKSFPGVKALDDVQMDVQSGEVHPDEDFGWRVSG